MKRVRQGDKERGEIWETGREIILKTSVLDKNIH
jgi:hypothetical protein